MTWQDFLANCDIIREAYRDKAMDWVAMYK
jgi:hypothetical protein